MIRTIIDIKNSVCRMVLLTAGALLLYTYESSAQVKTKFRQIKAVKITPNNTESSFTIKAATSTESLDAGMNIRGKIVVARNPLSGFKEVIEHGFVRGLGADLQFTGSNRGENGALPGAIEGTFRAGNNTIVLLGNVNGEWINARYTYAGTNAEITLIGNANGTIQTNTTLKYTTAVTNYSSYGGAITINTNGGSITSLTAAANYNYYPIATGGYGFTFTALGVYDFVGSGDQIFWFKFNFPF